METLKRYRLWAIVVSCCMIVLGAAMILRPDISALAVCYLTGALCIAMGVCEIARYFSIGVIGILFRFDLIVGILSTLAGVLLLAHPTGALTVLPIILGFYIIIDSVFSIQAAVELRRFGLGSWGLNLLLGIVGAVLGVLMILDPFDGAAALMIYMGVSLLLAGVESIYTVIRGSSTPSGTRSESSRSSAAEKNFRGGRFSLAFSVQLWYNLPNVWEIWTTVFLPYDHNGPRQKRPFFL